MSSNEFNEFLSKDLSKEVSSSHPVSDYIYWIMAPIMLLGFIAALPALLWLGFILFVGLVYVVLIAAPINLLITRKKNNDS